MAAVSCVVPVEMMCGSMSGGPSMTCIPSPNSSLSPRICSMEESIPPSMPLKQALC